MNNYDKTADVRCRFLDKLVWTRFNLGFLEQQKTGIESIVKLCQNHCHWIALETKTTGNFIGNKRFLKKHCEHQYIPHYPTNIHEPRNHLNTKTHLFALLRLCYSSLFRWAAEFPVVPGLYKEVTNPIQHGNRVNPH